MAIAYNTGRLAVQYVFKTTSGGTVWSSNLYGTAFDYFDDSPTVDDAIYFFYSSFYNFAGVELDVDTAMAGTDIVLKWEYWNQMSGAWEEIQGLNDATNSFTTTGSNLMVYFPYQAFWGYPTINGIASRKCVRCRLDSFTTVTEGGANTSDNPQLGDGLIIPDGTSGSPNSLEDLFQYMDTNFPEAGCVKNDERGISYNFDNVNIGIGGYWSMNRQVLAIGNGCVNGINNLRFNYCTDGQKVDKYGVNGSTIIFAGYLGGNIIGSTGDTKMYGTRFVGQYYKKTLPSGTYTSAAVGAYLGMQSGEWLNIQGYNMSMGYWSGSGNIILKGLYQLGNLCVTFPFRSGATLEDFKFFNDGSFRFGLYPSTLGGDREFEGVEWYNTSGTLFVPHSSLSTATYNYRFLNPSPKFPDQPNFIDTTSSGINKDWNVYESYSLDVKVVNVSGTAISGATVAIEDDNGDDVISSPFTTDANGEITTAKCLRRHAYYDSAVVIDDYNPYTVTVSKTGYQTKTTIITMEQKESLVITLEKQVDVVLAKGQLAINADPSNSQSDVFV